MSASSLINNASTESKYEIVVHTLPRFIHLPSNSRLIQDGNKPDSREVVFLDRDGVVVEDNGYLKKHAGLAINPGAAQAIKSMQQRYYNVIITNQSGVGRGYFTEVDLLNIHTELVRRLSYSGPHHPAADRHEYRLICDCRKPKPGMLIRASQEWDLPLTNSFIVGDRASDLEAGIAAGITPILVGEDPKGYVSHETPAVSNLSEAAVIILKKQANLFSDNKKVDRSNQ